MKALPEKHAEKIRFTLVGIASTIIDFGVLFTLVAFGMPSIISNYFSTTIASIFNFFAHKSFTYKDTSATTGKHVISYTIVTLGGLWLAQPVILYLNDFVFHNWVPASQLISWTIGLVHNSISFQQLTLFIGKCFATGATIIWNYFLYKRFVFKKDQSPSLL